jgi:hypothetical protein
MNFPKKALVLARTDRLGGKFFGALLLSLDSFRERGSGDVQSVPVAASVPAEELAPFWPEFCEGMGDTAYEVDDRGRVLTPVGKGGGTSSRFSFL